MPDFWFRRSFPALVLIFLLSAVSTCLAQPGGAQATPRVEQVAAAALSPESLPKVLAEGAVNLQSKIKPLAARLADSQQRLGQAQNDLKNLQIAVASLRAALAVEKPPMTQVQELLATYTFLEAQAKERARTLSGESAALKQEIAAETVAQNTLRNQMSFLQAAGDPAVASPELQQALSTYLQLADSRDRLAAQVWGNLDQARQLLDQENQLLAGLQPDLKKMEETWKTELLQRPPSRLSLQEQLVSLLAGLAALPGRAWQWLAALVASGELRGFFLGHLARLLGLAGFLALLGWSTRRLRRLTTRRFQDWRSRASDLDLLPLYLLGRTLVDSLFRLGLIFWVGILFWDFNALGSNLANFALYLLGAWWALRLALALVQVWFAGEAAAGVLALGAATARFYRRSLKIFVVYLFLGLFALKSAPWLNFPETSRLFAEHVFLSGLLIWVLWLL
ncbi:MAG: hypothetical protein ACHQ2F_13745, partial [Desulfobaccales bacterium]